jgi:hypothetical protein
MPVGKPKHKRSAHAYGQKDSPEMREKFLQKLRDGHTPGKAAALCGLGRRTVFDWKDKDKAFAAAWFDAAEMGIDLLEEEAIRRARDGVRKPIFHAGTICGHVQEYSDTLMTLMLKGRRRDIFNVERFEHTGADGEPIAVVQRTIVKAPPRSDKDK